MRLLHILTNIIFCILLCGNMAHAQLTAIGTHKVVPVGYVSPGRVVDSIYIYNETPKNWNTQKGLLRAIKPDTVSGWSFTWCRFNETTLVFDTLKTVTNTDTSFLDNLSQGGYSVRMRRDTLDTTLRAWICINKLRFFLVKTNDGKVKEFEYTCSKVELRAINKNYSEFPDSLQYFHEDFVYYNPATGEQWFTNDKVTFTWTGSDGSKAITNRNFYINYTPPAHNTRYTVTVADMFGNTAKDEVYYETISTKADFEIYLDTLSEPRLAPYKPDTTVANYIKSDEAIGEAPLHVMFKNKSKNGVQFEWVVSDTLFDKRDSLHYFTSDSLANVFHVYRNPYRDKKNFPGKYPVYLVSISPAGCRDTSETKNIEVEQSQFGDGKGNNAFPTAFRPDDPNNRANRYFYFKRNNNDENAQINWKSMRYLKLWVYSSWGRLVYSYDGELYKGWEGWNGKTLWGLDANAGVYYYVFEAWGWGQIGQNASTTKSESESETGTGTSTSTGAAPNAKLPKKIKGKGYVYLYR